MRAGMEMDQYRAIINLNRNVERLTLLYEYDLLTRLPATLLASQQDRMAVLRRQLWPSKHD